MYNLILDAGQTFTLAQQDADLLKIGMAAPLYVIAAVALELEQWEPKSRMWSFFAKADLYWLTMGLQL